MRNKHDFTVETDYLIKLTSLFLSICIYNKHHYRYRKDDYQ